MIVRENWENFAENSQFFRMLYKIHFSKMSFTDIVPALRLFQQKTVPWSNPGYQQQSGTNCFVIWGANH